MNKVSSQIAKKSNLPEKSQEKSSNLLLKLQRVKLLVEDAKNAPNVYEMVDILTEIEKVLDEDIST